MSENGFVTFILEQVEIPRNSTLIGDVAISVVLLIFCLDDDDSLINDTLFIELLFIDANKFLFLFDPKTFPAGVFNCACWFLIKPDDKDANEILLDWLKVECCDVTVVTSSNELPRSDLCELFIITFSN